QSSIFELTPNGDNKEPFGNIVRTDGFSVDFLFYKRQQSGHGASFQRFDLTLDDFSLDEVDNTYLPITLDPRRKSVFTAAVGLEYNRQVRRCTKSEYYHMTGSTQYSTNQIPSPKTSRLEIYELYTAYTLNNLDALLAFYGPGTAKDRFMLYQGRQRAPETMANILTHGTSKYNRKKRSKAKKKKKKKGKNVNEQQPSK
ncbi:hypothetical protein BDF20DRAFT_902006, partial [Mycotypha africana]|uniref:uncharacterized protein n=1 Tax=Mycotypha africana TaxID=64632 RepID=UPI0023003DD0